MKKTKVLSCIVVLVVLMSTMQSSLISSVSAAPIIPDPGVTVDKSSICCGGIIIVTVPVQNLKTETKNICIEIEIKDSAGNTIDSKTKSKSMGPGPYSYFTWKQSFQIKKPCENFGTYTVEVTVKEGSTVHDSDTATFAVKDCEPKPTPTPTEVKFSGRVTDKAPEGWTGSYWWDVKVDEWISGTMPCDIIRVGFVVLPDVPIGSYNMTLDIGDYVEVYGPVDPPCYVSLNGESYYIKYVPEAVKEVKFRGEILADYPIISFYSFDVKIAEILDDPTGNLQEGETVNVYGHRDGPAQVDDVTVGDEVEVFGEYRGYVGTYEQIFLSDCDESSSDHYVKKIEEKKPDLIIQDIYWSPANPKKGDAVTFTVKIKNQGSGSAGSSTVKYYIDDSYITSDSMPALSAGFTSTQTFTWTANKCGNVQVKAIADYFDDVDESNEGNNERTETLSIPCKPDLIIQDISGSPSTPKNGDTVTFTVTIKNQGSGSADGFYVCYYVDDSYYDRDYVSSLSAGSTKTTSFSWTAESGSHTIKAIADCYGAIGESNEGNNEKSITIEIEEESEEIKFIGTLTAQVMPMGFTKYFLKVDRVLKGSIPVGDEIGVMVYASGVYPPLNNYDPLDIGDKAEVHAVFLKEQGKQYDPWVDREVWSADITGDEKYYVEKISPKTIYVDDDFVYDDPSNHKWNTIQEGINDANDGDTILVYPGPYTENVDVTKSVTIKSTSGNPVDTIVQAAVSNQNYQNVFTITADNVYINGFTIKGASYFWCSGIWLNGSNCVISNNTFEDNAIGVWIHSPSLGNNTIRENNFSSSSGYSPSTALYLEVTGNKIYLNNFIIGIEWEGWSGNIWNSPSSITYTYNGNTFTNYLGNYWDDYEEKYPYAKEKDNTGIWDTPYSIDGDRDYYPLREGFENFEIESDVIRMIDHDSCLLKPNTKADPKYRYPEYAEVTIYTEKVSEDEVRVYVELNTIMQCVNDSTDEIHWVDFGQGFEKGAITVLADEEATILWDKAKLMVKGELESLDIWPWNGANTLREVAYSGDQSKLMPAKKTVTHLPSGVELVIYKGGNIVPAFYYKYRGEMPYTEWKPSYRWGSIVGGELGRKLLMEKLPVLGDLTSIEKVLKGWAEEDAFCRLLEQPPQDIFIPNYDEATRSWAGVLAPDQRHIARFNSVVLIVPVEIKPDKTHSVVVRGKAYPYVFHGGDFITFTKSFEVNHGKPLAQPTTAGEPYITPGFVGNNIILDEAVVEKGDTRLKFTVFMRPPEADPFTKYIFVEVSQFPEHGGIGPHLPEMKGGFASITVEETAQVPEDKIITGCLLDVWTFMTCDAPIAPENYPDPHYYKAIPVIEDWKHACEDAVKFIATKMPKVGDFIDLVLTRDDMIKYLDDCATDFKIIRTNEAEMDTFGDKWVGKQKFPIGSEKYANVVTVFPIRFCYPVGNKIAVRSGVVIGSDEFLYSKVLEIPYRSISASLSTPANLHAYDSQGRHVGVNEQGEIDLEIPNSYYTGPNSEPEEIVIFGLSKDIKFRVEALDKGEFNLTIRQNTETETKEIVYEDVSIIETTEAWVDVSLENPKYSMKIDYDGDGKTDEEKSPGAITGIIFDTGTSANQYSSISGTHAGTITPNQDITVQKLYTYLCAGTGGHTESVRIYGNEIDESASWAGYAEDWHNITFDSSFTLEAGKTYNYEIITGSYPQIHHTPALQTENGWLNCTQFTDANGKVYYNWIPAIKLF